MNQTGEMLCKTYNLSYDSEMDVVFHWSQKRGWTPLSERKNGKVSYYLFKHEGKTTYVSKSVIVEAFAEPPRKYYVMDRCNAYYLEDIKGAAKLYVEDTEHEDNN